MTFDLKHFVILRSAFKEHFIAINGLSGTRINPSALKMISSFVKRTLWYSLPGAVVLSLTKLLTNPNKSISNPLNF